MSTRYLWDTYNVISVDVEGKPRSVSGVGFNYNPNRTYWAAASNSYTFREGRFRFDNGYVLLEISGTYAIDAKTYPYLMFLSSDSLANSPAATSILYNSNYQNTSEPVSWYKNVTNSASGYVFYDVYLLNSNDIGASGWNYRTKLYSYMETEKKNAQGAQSKGRISSNNFSAYPRDGADSKATTWYKYVGSDNIDPSAVIYTKSELQAGDAVGISINPRSPVYGGTVYYQFSYSINGGSTWVNVGSKTTSLGVSITIPVGAQQFQARAVVSDGWGFMSNTLVLGPILGVSVLNGYVGMDGQSKKATKLYVGVDGRAREVIRGYIGVDGRSRKFM